MYSSYLTRETFENEHDEKMTRKFSYNYQVLNGATFGAYNYLDRHSDNAAAERYNRLQNDAYQAGIGNWYDRVQDANGLAGKYIRKYLLKK